MPGGLLGVQSVIKQLGLTIPVITAKARTECMQVSVFVKVRYLDERTLSSECAVWILGVPHSKRKFARFRIPC
jgi:hypothetical protein